LDKLLDGGRGVKQGKATVDVRTNGSICAGIECLQNRPEFLALPGWIVWQNVESNNIGFEGDPFFTATFVRAFYARDLRARDAEGIASRLLKSEPLGEVCLVGDRVPAEIANCAEDRSGKTIRMQTPKVEGSRCRIQVESD